MMPIKSIVTGFEHRVRVLAGIKLVDKLVGASLGPAGRNLILDRGFSIPLVTNDGVSIAQSIQVEDEIEQQGVELIREVAKKTNEVAGDGTTTSVVFAHALVEEGLRYSENPMEIRRLLKKAAAKAAEMLKSISVKIHTKEQIKEIATISASSEEMGRIIADTVEAIGKDGSISVIESKLPETEVKIVEGYEVEKGYASAHMANNAGRAEFEKVHTLVIGEKLTSVVEVAPLFQEILAQNIRELVIFCVDADSTVINTFLANKLQGVCNVLIVKAHSQKNEVLHDIAIVTGATFVSKEAGHAFESLTPAVLGKAEKIFADKERTVILNGGGNVSEKVKQLKEELKSTTDDNAYDLIEKRIARLNGGVAVISVGGKTEQEMRDNYYKMEDAVNAVKAAIEEGVVEGGGMTLYRIAGALEDTDIGTKILQKALRAPLKRIIENAGEDYAEVLLNRPKGKGYDALTKQYVDMVKEGIIDPTKVERCCIENGVSFAGEFLTSVGTVALRRDKTKSDD